MQGVAAAKIPAGHWDARVARLVLPKAVTQRNKLCGVRLFFRRCSLAAERLRARCVLC